MTAIKKLIFKLLPEVFPVPSGGDGAEALRVQLHRRVEALAAQGPYRTLNEEHAVMWPALPLPVAVATTSPGCTLPLPVAAATG